MTNDSKLTLSQMSRSQAQPIVEIMTGQTGDERDGNYFDTRANAIIDHADSVVMRLGTAATEAFVGNHPQIGHKVLDLLTRSIRG